VQSSIRLRPARSLGDRVMKVNHAGEEGAICIYRGQRWVAAKLMPDLVSELAEYQSHEERHRAVFAAELSRRGLRRCRSFLLCAGGGTALGVVTGLMGRKAIAATTVAVERVVLRHLEDQKKSLAAIDLPAVCAIERIERDEQAHHDLSTRDLGHPMWWQRVLMAIVSASTEAVIWLGMRI